MTTSANDLAVRSPDVAASNAPVADKPFVLTNAYRFYVVWSLCGVYLINIMDRQLMSLLMEPIRTEFGLLDRHMGFLGGFAFAIFYTVLGVPLARVADRGHRINLIAISIVVWSAFTAATGLAKNFWHLLLARIGVGIGEAGCNPAAYSLIGDYFDSKRRATALGIYQAGSYIGTFVGMFLGGFIAHTYGWRTAFFWVGLPGLLIAIVLKLTVRELPRGYSDPNAVVTEPPSSIAVLRTLWSKSSFRHLSFAAALHNFAIYGAGTFYSAFLIRTHGFNIKEVGLWLGLVTVIGGVGGTLCGGLISDRLATRSNDSRHYLWVPALSLIVGFPLAQTVLAVNDPTLVLWLLVPSIFCSAAFLAPSITATYRLVTLRERALASALLLFILNMIGLGFGPWLVGILSDFLRASLLESGQSETQALADGLRWSLRIVVIVNLWSAVHYFIAARTLRAQTVVH